MQTDNRRYNPQQHDRFKALIVRQPFADLIVAGDKTIEVRSRATRYRGDVLICSASKPVLPDMLAGSTIGFAELYDIKPVSEFTEDDWEHTRIDRTARLFIRNGYGWFLRNTRKVIEFPVRAKAGFRNVTFTKGEIIEYPTHIIYDI